MRFMNEYEVDAALDWFDEEDQPNLIHAARVLYRLKEYVNRSSDGWPYWQAPQRAAQKLVALVHNGREVSRGTYGTPDDITERELKAAFTPLKSFLTRQNVNHSEVFYQ